MPGHAFSVDFAFGDPAGCAIFRHMETDTEDPPCAVCGQPAHVIINAVAWCDSCFHEMGSCCGEWNQAEP